MVVAAVEEEAESLFAGVSARAVPAVVPEVDRLGEGDVEPGGPGHGGGDLGHFQGVGEPGALMVIGDDEYLGLPRQAPEGGGVEDPVAVALEAGTQRIGILWSGPAPGTAGP